MPLLLHAARGECAKLERPLGDAEVAGVGVKPRVEVDIDRLVLHGVAAHEAPAVAAALRARLAELLATPAWAARFATGGDVHVPALALHAAASAPAGSPADLGGQVASAVHGGLAR
jgi:hypothetical protein